MFELGDFPYNWVDIISILQYFEEEVFVSGVGHFKQEGSDQLFLTSEYTVQSVDASVCKCVCVCACILHKIIHVEHAATCTCIYYTCRTCSYMYMHVLHM